MISRLIALIIAIIYLVLSYTLSGTELLLRMLIFLLLPLFCIWFGDEMGGYTGPSFRFFESGRYIDTESPGCLVRFIGWFLLLLPLLLFVISYFSSR